MGRLGTLISMVRSKQWDGLRAVLERDLVPARLFRRNAMAIVKLRECRPLPRPLEAAVFRWGRREDEPALQAIRPRPKGYGHQFDAGHLLFIGEFGGEVASYSWFETESPHRSKSNGYLFHYPFNAVWAFGLEVHPRFRLSGIFHKHWVEGLRLLRARGVDTVYGSVQLDNNRSIQSHFRLGFEFLWELHIMRLAGLTRHRARPGTDGSGPIQSGWSIWQGRDPAYQLPEATR